ncbi:MBL fold metallo-hydrolase [Melittangium boletus]|uniref:Membrane protein n=1 Tax=Melittangium boletus DSM 14713 TaxID=1294270 RepID=A0A250IDN4_9BACT|nr:MBL fold metallo-hydrolase [Melittangium boletus]ATB29974.1 membrane protein [Melittangium boletus DSM 14713]
MSRIKSWVSRAALGVGALVVLLAVLAGVDGWKAFGQRASGERRARMERSPQWKDGRFVNPQPIINDNWGSVTSLFERGFEGTPTSPVTTAAVDPRRFDTPPATGLRVTWLGHSSNLVEIDGHRVLTDPFWGERTSPLTWLGPKRWYAPLIALDALPRVDAVVISHDHYDHLDYATLVAMKDWDTRFVVPLGVGAHLAYWGIPEERIVELDWWESTKVRDLEIVCTPARHASGRYLLDNNMTLWGGFALRGPSHRAFFSGDTGLFPAFRDIGERLGPFDVTLLEVGQYGRPWPDWHMGPEQAILAHQMLRGRVLLPVHWGLVNLAMHTWTEPIERALVAARSAQVTIAQPRPGESLEPEARPEPSRWWPDLPRQTAEQNPIVSSQME